MFTPKPASDTPDSVLQTITEISQRMARAYRDKAGDAAIGHQEEREYFAAHGDKEGARHELKQKLKRQAGIRRASSKIRKSKDVKVPVSEQEQLDEAPKGSKHRVHYEHQGEKGITSGTHTLYAPDKDRARSYAHADLKGGNKKGFKITRVVSLGGKFHQADGPLPLKEEQIDELSQGTLKSYMTKAKSSHTDLVDKAAKASAKGFWDKDKEADKQGEHLSHKARKRANGMFRAGMQQDRQRLMSEDLTKTTRGKYFGRNVAFKGLEHPINEDLTGAVEKKAKEDGTERVQGKFMRNDMEGVKIDPSGELIQKYTNSDNHGFELYKKSNGVLELRDSKRQILKSWHTENVEVMQKMRVKYGLMPDPVEDNYAANEKKEQRALEEDATEGKKKVVAEQLEQIDELSKGTVKRYLANRGGYNKRTFNKKYHQDIKGKYGPKDPEVKQYDRMEGHHQARLKSIGNARKRVGQDFDRQKHIEDSAKASSDTAKKYSGWQSTPHGNGHVVGKDDTKADHVILRVSTGKGVRSKNDTSSKDISVHKKHLKEGVEQIDELSRKTLGNYIKRAHDQAPKLQKDAEAASRIGHDMKTLDGNKKGADKMFQHAGKQVRKSANRTIGLVKATNKLMKEGQEKDSFKRLVGTDSLLKNFVKDTPGQEDGSEPRAINELSQGKLEKYARRASGDFTMAKTGERGSVDPAAKKYWSRSAAKRKAGIAKAYDKMDAPEGRNENPVKVSATR